MTYREKRNVKESNLRYLELFEKVHFALGRFDFALRIVFIISVNFLFH